MAEKDIHEKVLMSYAEALCGMMESLTGDTRFTSLIGQLISRQKKKGKIIMCEYIDMLEARGQAKGENMLASLLNKLYSLGRDDDAKRAVKDEAFRKRLYQEFCIV